MQASTPARGVPGPHVGAGHALISGPRPTPGHRGETEAQRPPGALRDGKKTRKRRTFPGPARGSQLPGSGTLAPQRLQNKAGAASQGPARTIPALSPRPQPQPNLRLVPSPRQLAPQPCLAAGSSAWGSASGRLWAAPMTPARTWALGSQRPTPGLPPSAGQPGCLGRPAGDGGAGQAWHWGGIPCRTCPEVPAHSVSKDFLQSPRQHQGPPTGAGGLSPPPRPSMDPGRCWPAIC